MRGCAEALEPDPPTIPCHTQRTPADQAGAQEWRCCDIVASIRKEKYEAGVGNDVRGIAAVSRVTSEQRLLAQVLPPIAAIRTPAASPAKPGNADTRADRQWIDASANSMHSPDNFVARNNRK
jgi:hypothetical protein